MAKNTAPCLAVLGQVPPQLRHRVGGVSAGRRRFLRSCRHDAKFLACVLAGPSLLDRSPPY